MKSLSLIKRGLLILMALILFFSFWENTIIASAKELDSITNNEFLNGNFTYYIYPNNIKPTGISISCYKNYTIHESVRMSVRVNESVYSSDYINDFFCDYTVNYPETTPGTPIEIWFETDNGLTSEIYKGKIYDKKIDVDVSDVTFEGFHGYASTAINKAYVEINGRKFDCKIEYGTHFSVKYKALAGDKIYFFIIDTEGYTHKREYTVPKSIGTLKITKSTVYKTCWTFKSKTSDIVSSYAIINGHRYNGKYDDDGYFSSFDYYCEAHKANYREKVNSRVTVYVKTEDGGVFTKTATLKGVTPSLSVWKMRAGDKNIEGFTKENSNLTAKIGKKLYKTKSDKEGYYKIKTKGFKCNTKIKVTVNNETGCKNTKTIIVKKAKGSLRILNTIYKGTKTAKVRITYARKGDFIKLCFGNKTITKKIKKNYKKKSFVFKISNLVAGKYVRVEYKDKYKTTKDSDYRKIYFGDSIYVGMSAKNAQLTTWGSPARRNDYSGYLQWVFESGGSTLYAYIRNGVVTDIQRLNY